MDREKIGFSKIRLESGAITKEKGDCFFLDDPTIQLFMDTWNRILLGEKLLLRETPIWKREVQRLTEILSGPSEEIERIAEENVTNFFRILLEMKEQGLGKRIYVRKEPNGFYLLNGMEEMSMLSSLGIDSFIVTEGGELIPRGFPHLVSEEGLVPRGIGRRKLSREPSVQWAKEDDGTKKKCNIVIPCFNLVEHTKLCIESIKRNAPSFSYRIVAIDDGSRDGTYEYLKEEGITLIRHEENAGWWRSLNDGISCSEADYYLLLDRDVIVTKRWLDKLLQVFTKGGKDVGVVSPTSNAGPETFGTQCFMNTQDPIIERFFRSRNPYTPSRIYWLISPEEIETFASQVQNKYRGRIDYQCPLFSFAWMVSDEVIQKIGFFNEAYVSWHSDLEYSWKVMKEGLIPAVRLDTYVHHFKFPPLTEVEMGRLPYLRKYPLLKVGKEMESLGQFLDEKQQNDTNRDFLIWDKSPFKGRSFYLPSKIGRGMKTKAKR